MKLMIPPGNERKQNVVTILWTCRQISVNISNGELINETTERERLTHQLVVLKVLKRVRQIQRKRVINLRVVSARGNVTVQFDLSMNNSVQVIPYAELKNVSHPHTHTHSNAHTGLYIAY